ncbi:MAG TPA: VCBS repeat-containing protein, partial [Tepidisphaeraceae bacterium]|nr:VCBS repeat-containing protein [Tepidisphaeraceae bacterium]
MVRLRDAGRVSNRLFVLRDVLGAAAMLGRIKRRGRSRAQTAHSLSMLVDALENRTLLSALPAPTTTFDTSITGPITSGTTNYSSPSIAYDPVDPMKVVEASVEDAPSRSGDQNVLISLSYSTNGGATWSNIDRLVSGNLADPVTTTTDTIHYFVDATDPTVGFDRFGNFYLTYSEHGTSNTSGDIILDKFAFDTTTNQPAAVFTDNVVYAWKSADSAVIHPTMAIDTNVQSYTADGITLTDPTIDPVSGVAPIYIGWATDFVIPNPPSDYNPNAIQVVESSDGGQFFGPPVYMNVGQNFGVQRDTYPQLVVSQGSLKTNPNSGLPLVEPGQLTAIWDDFGTGANAGPPIDYINSSYLDQSVEPSLALAGSLVDPSNPLQIQDAVGSAAPYTPGVTTVSFNVTLPDSFVLSDMYVQLALTEPNFNAMEIILTAPDGSSFDLVSNAVDNSNTAIPGQGLTGSALGVVTNLADPTAGIIGTTFDGNATTNIYNKNVASPYIGTYAPEASTPGNNALAAFDGETASQLNGIWTITFIDNVPDSSNSVPAQIDSLKVGFTSAVQSAQTNVATTYVHGALSGPFPLTVPSSPSLGVGPGAVLASDNTIGAFSTQQGYLYVALTTKASNATTNTDISLYSSSDGGQNWNLVASPVNDDAATVDGYSGTTGATDDRSQYEPSIAVDQANGTLVLTWYDARYDAADARVSRYITTSLDGGASFGGQTYLNEPNQVYDAITGEATNLGPIPDNFSAGDSVGASEGQFYQGAFQGLAVYDGRVFAAWTGNVNGGPVGNERLEILTSTTTYASGPRVISSTQGVVSTSEDIVNPAQNLGGTTGIVPAFQYIDVVFDRPVVPSSFLTSDIDIQYRDVNTPGTQPATADLSSLIISITPLDLQNWGTALAPAATTYRVALSTPQTAVGTYSYSISPSISDGYVYFGLDDSQSTTFTASNPSTNAELISQVNLAVPKLGTLQTNSLIKIPTGKASGQEIVNVIVNVQLDGPIDALTQYTLTLLGPNGVSVILAANEYGASQTAGNSALEPDLNGHGYVSTTFDDESTQPIADGNFQFSGTFHPTGNLAAFDGATLNVGDVWTLQITSNQPNTGSVPVGFLRDWSIQFQTQLPRDYAVVQDFNGDGFADYAFISGNKVHVAIYNPVTAQFDVTQYLIATDGSNGIWIQYGDFNANGFGDLRVLSSSGSWLLAGNGDGTF